MRPSNGGSRSYGEDLVPGELFRPEADQLVKLRRALPGDEEIEVLRVRCRVVGIAREPRAINSRGGIVPEGLGADQRQSAPESPPLGLCVVGRVTRRVDTRCRQQACEFLSRTEAAVVIIRQIELRGDFVSA